MTLLKIALGLGVFYLVCILLVALVQDRLLFPRWAMRGGTVPLPAAAERLSIEIPGVGPLVGVFLPAAREPPPEAALLLGFGGNAWDADLLAMYLRSVHPARDVVTFHYRGYGPSAGRPSAEAILEDAVRIYDELVAAHDAEQVVAVGLSLGAGPAAHLASQRPIAGLILVTPFDSLGALAGDLYPWLPVRLLLRHRMDVVDAVARSSAKVAIIAAAQDEIVPPRRTAARRGTSDEIVLIVSLPGSAPTIYDSEEFAGAMGKALLLREKQARSGR